MLEAALARWGSVIELFFTAPAALLGGSASSFAVVGGFGIAMLVLGLLFIAIQRARQAWRLVFPLGIAAISSLLYPLGSMVGTVAVAIFFFIVVALAIILWVAAVARDSAGRRAGIWLFGIGLFCLALLGIMVEITLPVSLRGL